MARAGDDDARDDGLAVAGLHRPEPRVFIERGARGGDAKADVRTDCVLGRAMLEIGEDLSLGREESGPVGVVFERIGVEVRRNVAGNPRVRVVAPGSSETVASLEDGEVVDARLFEPNRHAEPGEARADDEHMVCWMGDGAIGAGLRARYALLGDDVHG